MQNCTADDIEMGKFKTRKIFHNISFLKQLMIVSSLTCFSTSSPLFRYDNREMVIHLQLAKMRLFISLNTIMHIFHSLGI